MPGTLMTNRHFQWDFPRPAGGYYSTVGDLQTLGAAITHDGLLSAESRGLMTNLTSRRRETPHLRLGHGVGLDIYEFSDGRSIGHGGGRPGASSRLDILSSGYTLTVLSNYEWVAHTAADHLLEVLPMGAEGTLVDP